MEKEELDKLSEVYKDKRITNAIEDVMLEVGHRFKDVTKVEAVIYKNILRTIERKVVGVLNPSFVRRLAHREASDLFNRNRYTEEEYTRFSELDASGDDGSEMAFEPVDESAEQGGQALLFKELIDKIAPIGDIRRRIVAEEWARGETNDRDIARLLVEEIGGQLKTHVTFITRYRKECQRILGGTYG